MSGKSEMKTENGSWKVKRSACLENSVILFFFKIYKLDQPKLETSLV